MIPSNKKIERMIQIARLYYEEDMTQHLIAQKLGISRPLVSQLLTEAKSCGIVSIRINEVENREALLQHQLLERFGLSNVVVVPDDTTPEETDRDLASAVYQYCFQPDANGLHVGLGCGSILGMVADIADAMPPRPRHTGRIFPLIGGLPGSSRGLHPNEMVRIFADKAGFQGDFLYAPAILESENELQAVRNMGLNKNVVECWEKMDMAVINLMDFPATEAAADAFQPMPPRSEPVGHVLGHSSSAQGAQVPLKVNNIFEASMTELRKAKQVVAICPSSLNSKALEGAMGLDLIDTLILPVSMAQKLLNA